LMGSAFFVDMFFLENVFARLQPQGRIEACS